MASVDTEARSLVKIGCHSCADEGFSATHIQQYAEFSVLDTGGIKLTTSATMYNLNDDTLETHEQTADYGVGDGESN